MDKNNLHKRIAFASENFQAKYLLKQEITKSTDKEKESRRQLADKINPHFPPLSNLLDMLWEVTENFYLQHVSQVV